jgi:hypothetical protein
MGKALVKNLILEVGIVCNPNRAIPKNPNATETSLRNSRPSGLGKMIKSASGKNTIKI